MPRCHSHWLRMFIDFRIGVHICSSVLDWIRCFFRRAFARSLCGAVEIVAFPRATLRFALRGDPFGGFVTCWSLHQRCEAWNSIWGLVAVRWRAAHLGSGLWGEWARYVSLRAPHEELCPCLWKALIPKRSLICDMGVFVIHCVMYMNRVPLNLFCLANTSPEIKSLSKRCVLMCP